VCITGGAALSSTVQHFFDDIGIPVIEGYQSTRAPYTQSTRVIGTQSTRAPYVPRVPVYLRYTEYRCTFDTQSTLHTQSTLVG
jgi:hypothetical protein